MSFEITINGSPSTYIDINHYDLVTIGIVFVKGATHPILQATAMQKSTDSHPMLLGIELSKEDVVRIDYVSKINTDTDTIRQGCHEHLKTKAYDIDRKPSARPATKCTLGLSFNDEKSILASVGGNSMLQLTVTWIKTPETCKLELGCIGNDGNCDSEIWLERVLNLGMAVKVRVHSFS